MIVPWWVKSKQPSIQILSSRIGIASLGGCSGKVSAMVNGISRTPYSGTVPDWID